MNIKEKATLSKEDLEMRALAYGGRSMSSIVEQFPHLSRRTVGRRVAGAKFLAERAALADFNDFAEDVCFLSTWAQEHLAIDDVTAAAAAAAFVASRKVSFSYDFVQVHEAWHEKLDELLS